MIVFMIDEITPCLKDTETGEIFETEVIQLKRKSFLSKFNRRNGWYINWSRFTDDVSVYALVLKGTVDIQGLIATATDEEAKAVQICWACTAPHNNKLVYGRQKYSGVGGHLLAIASELSVKQGFEGFIYGEAMDQELFDYYQKEFGALPLPRQIHPFAFMLTDKATKYLREVYDYVWTDEVL